MYSLHFIMFINRIQMNKHSAWLHDYNNASFILLQYLSRGSMNGVVCAWGFCQVKKNRKIREKLGSGWVGQAPTLKKPQFFFFRNVVLFCVVFMFPNVS